MKEFPSLLKVSFKIFTQEIKMNLLLTLVYDFSFTEDLLDHEIKDHMNYSI